VLKYASVIFGELKKTLLSPKNYYELCILANEHYKYITVSIEQQSKSCHFVVHSIISVGVNILDSVTQTCSAKGVMSISLTYSVTYISHQLYPLEQFLSNVLKEEAAKGITIELDEFVKRIDDDLPCM